MKLLCERCYHPLEYRSFNGLDALYVEPCQNCEDPDLREEIEYLISEYNDIDSQLQSEFDWTYKQEEEIKVLQATISKIKEERK